MGIGKVMDYEKSIHLCDQFVTLKDVFCTQRSHSESALTKGYADAAFPPRGVPRAAEVEGLRCWNRKTCQSVTASKRSCQNNILSTASSPPLKHLPAVRAQQRQNKGFCCDHSELEGLTARGVSSKLPCKFQVLGNISL